jgi:hypothetical protein
MNNSNEEKLQRMTFNKDIKISIKIPMTSFTEMENKVLKI